MWSLRLEQLCEFKVQFGHSAVPQQYADNRKLGYWVAKQRKEYRLHLEGKPSPMREGRIRELESSGFDWGVSKTDLASIWSMRFQQLCEFKAKFGHYLVPEQYAANFELGRWFRNQRSYYKLYREGKPSSITAEQFRKMESIQLVIELVVGYQRSGVTIDVSAMKSTNTTDCNSFTDLSHVSSSTSSTFSGPRTAVRTPDTNSSIMTSSKLSWNSRDVGPLRTGLFAGQKHSP